MQFCIDEDTPNNDLLYLCSRYQERAINIYMGRNRNVFDMGSYVIKVPKNYDGITDNDWEGSISNGESYNDPDEIQYARTRLHYHNDIPIVFMEKVTYAGNKNIKEKLGYIPDWIMSVDCGQVGFNKHNRLVAFDYGLR